MRRVEMVPDRFFSLIFRFTDWQAFGAPWAVPVPTFHWDGLAGNNEFWSEFHPFIRVGLFVVRVPYVEMV